MSDIEHASSPPPHTLQQLQQQHSAGNPQGAITKHDEQHIQLLLQIVSRAQQNPIAQESPKIALDDAYDQVYDEYGFDPSSRDDACYHTLVKVLDHGLSEGNLFERLEDVLRREGVELSFDDDTSNHETVPSTNASGPSTHETPNPRELRPSLKRSRSALSSQQASHPAAASLPHGQYNAHVQTTPSQVDYTDSPPPYIGQLLQRAQDFDRRKLLENGLRMFRPWRDLGAMEHAANDHYEANLASKALSHMRAVVRERQARAAQADVICRENLAKAFFQSVRDASRVQRMQAMDEQRLKGMAMYNMTLANREIQFVRRKELGLKARVFTQLVNTSRRYQGQQQQLHTLLHVQGTRSAGDRSRQAIRCLRQELQDVQQMHEQADQHFAYHLKSAKLVTWYEKAQHVQTLSDIATKHYNMRILAQSLGILRDAANRRKVLARWVLKRWREMLYRKAYRAMRIKVKKNLARRLMQKIGNTAHRVSANAVMANNMYEQKILDKRRDMFINIYEKSHQTFELQHKAQDSSNRRVSKRALTALSERFVYVQQLDQRASAYHEHIAGRRVAGRCLKTMSRRDFELHRRVEDAQAFRQRHERKHMRLLLEKLRTVVAEKKGEGPLRLPPATPAQKRAQELRRITTTTPLYTPATRMSFTARLRGDGISVAGRSAEQIIEEMDEVEPE